MPQINAHIDISTKTTGLNLGLSLNLVLYDFLGTVKAAPHECVIRTGQP